MWADKIVKEKKGRDKIVGRIERSKPLFGFVPCLELLVKAFYQVVGDIIAKALDSDMLDAQYCFNRNFVGAVAVCDNSCRFAEMFDGIQ